jgi:hypothetical protein
MNERERARGCTATSRRRWRKVDAVAKRTSWVAERRTVEVDEGDQDDDEVV